MKLWDVGSRIFGLRPVVGFRLGVVLASFWWYFMPKGFPLNHPRFWVNEVFPLLTIALCVMGAIAVARKQNGILKCLIWFFGTTGIVAPIATIFLFPESVHGKFLVAVLVFLAIATLTLMLFLRTLKKTNTTKTVAALSIGVGVFFGIFLPWSQRAAASATHPTSQNELPVLPALSDSQKGLLSLSDAITVFPENGMVKFGVGETSLHISPLLTFESRSPDRFWTIFSPASFHSQPERHLLGSSRNTDKIRIQYEDDGYSRLEISKNKMINGFKIEATSHLSKAVFSHLNSFCTLQVSCPGTLSVSFSPCVEIVEMKLSDYPVGKPARLAYLDAGNVFHVVEANSGEKGPFKTLGKGMIKKDETLMLSIYSDGKPIYRISLYDWAKQASKQLSPSAGWRLPENAIEFSLITSGNRNSGVIFFTLAGTSVGRGWDSVGHAAGIYRNLLEIEAVDPGK